MASNIRVTLEVDSRKYLGDLKQAEQATKSFSQAAQTNLTASERGFQKLSSGIDVVHRRLTGLGTAIAAVGFGALTRSSLEFASSIKDLSDATGVAVGDLLDLGNALAVSGGRADKMPEIIGRFSAALEDAGSNAGRSLYNFEKLGISLQDIGRLDQQELFKKTLEGLVRLGPGVERTTRMVELFGKAGRTLDPQSLLDRLNASSGSSSQYADNIKRAAELSDQLAVAQQKLSVAFINAFAPAIERIAELADKINNSEEALKSLTDTLKVVGVVLATVFSATALLTFVRIIGTIGRGVAQAGIAMGVFADSARALFAPMGRILVIGRAIALLASAGFGIYAATQLFDDFGDIASNAMARVVESIGRMVGEVANLPTDAIAKLLNMIPGIRIENPVGLGTPLLIFAERAKKAREEIEALARANRQARRSQPGAVPGSDPNTALPEPTGGEGGAGAPGQDIQGALRVLEQQRQAVQRISEAFADSNRQQLEKIQLDTSLVGSGKDTVEVLQMQRELAERMQNSIQQLEERKANLREEDARLIPVIEEQIRAIRAQRAIDDEALTQAIRQRQAREAADRLAIQTARGAAEVEQLRAQMLGYSLTALEKFNQAQQAGDFRDKTREEIDLLRRQAEQIDGLTASLSALQTNRQTEAQLLELQTQILGRQFSAVEKLEQLRSQNPEAYARRTQEENAALERQARLIDETTTRLRALAFARDLTRQGEDFAQQVRDQMRLDTEYSEGKRRSLQVEIDLNNQLRTKLREIQDAYGDEATLSAERRAARQAEIDAAIQGFERLRQEQQRLVISDQTQREQFAFGWNEAFGRYAAAARDNAQQARTYFDTFSRGVEDAIVRFVQTGKLSFKDLANSLIAEFARIQAKRALAGLFDLGGGGGGGGFSFGTLLGGIGKIFGFANGGNPAIGKPIITGENGPELWIPRNAGTIIPNNQAFGGGQTIQQVTYQIQATDAQSFKQLIARDPQFIHSVVEQGKRGTPMRRMR